MKRILITAFALAVGATSCNDKPESSGTHTNWLEACVETQDCGGEGSCLCGLCTSPCSSDAECGSGICGSALDTSQRCGRSGSAPLCLPEARNGALCAEQPVPAGAELGAALEPACDVPGALLCESFDAPLPPEYATLYIGSVTALVQECLVRAGAGALHYQSDASGYAQTRMRLPEPVASGPLHARFYAYVPSGFSIPTYLVLFELWAEEASSAGKLSVEALASGVLEVEIRANGSTHPAGAGSLLRDRWMCIELALDVAPTGGSVSLAVNGTRVLEAANVVTLPATPISVAVVEAFPSDDSGAVEVAIDELVIATQPIGCL